MSGFTPGSNATPFCYLTDEHELCSNPECTCSCHWHGDRAPRLKSPTPGSDRARIEVPA